MKQKINLANFRPQILGGIYVLYLVLFKDVFSKSMGWTVYGGRVNIVLAVVLISALVLETVGIGYKTAHLGALMNRMKKKDEEISGAPLFYAWVFHIIVGVILVMTAGRAIFGPGDGENMNIFVIILIFIEVIRNIVILVIISGIGEYTDDISPRKHLLADIYLLLFNIVAYTGTWGVFVVHKGMKISGGDIGKTIVYTFCMILAYLIFFLPLNMVYFMEQGIKTKTRQEKIRDWVILAIIIFFALRALY